MIGGGLGVRFGQPIAERIADRDAAAPVQRHAPAGGARGRARRPRRRASARRCWCRAQQRVAPASDAHGSRSSPTRPLAARRGPVGAAPSRPPAASPTRRGRGGNAENRLPTSERISRGSVGRGRGSEDGERHQPARRNRRSRSAARTSVGRADAPRAVAGGSRGRVRADRRGRGRALIVLGGGSSYTLRAEFQNAGGLVTGDQRADRPGPGRDGQLDRPDPQRRAPR